MYVLKAFMSSKRSLQHNQQAFDILDQISGRILETEKTTFKSSRGELNIDYAGLS